ncbi:MAG TPA: hypothetical protein VER33_01100 [Polyangiaceae bacterium]|nr:hypothetical protein [Polyangiaceae bacterium]
MLAKLFWLTDHVAMRCADRMMMDSDHQVHRRASTYRVDAKRVTRIHLSSDETLMPPCPGVAPPPRFRVHFHGEFAPFHGVDVILRAAKLLQGHEVDFQIIGTGITYARD